MNVRREVATNNRSFMCCLLSYSIRTFHVNASKVAGNTVALFTINLYLSRYGMNSRIQ
jgi:hypothetical protein